VVSPNMRERRRVHSQSTSGRDSSQRLRQGQVNSGVNHGDANRSFLAALLKIVRRREISRMAMRHAGHKLCACDNLPRRNRIAVRHTACTRCRRAGADVSAWEDGSMVAKNCSDETLRLDLETSDGVVALAPCLADRRLEQAAQARASPWPAAAPRHQQDLSQTTLNRPGIIT